MTFPTPRLTGPQPAAPEPLCGANLPSVPGAHCEQPAAWHVRYDPSQRPGAGLLCAAHMDQLARHHAWWQRHPAGAACSSNSPSWTADHCTEGDQT